MFPYGSYLVEVLIPWYFTTRGLFSCFLLHLLCHQYTILLSQWWTWLEIKYSKCFFPSFSKGNKTDKNRFTTYSFWAKWFFLPSCRADLCSCRQRRQQRVVLLFLAGGEGEELSCSLGSSTAWAAAGLTALQHLLTESKWRKHLALDSLLLACCKGKYFVTSALQPNWKQ